MNVFDPYGVSAMMPQTMTPAATVNERWPQPAAPLYPQTAGILSAPMQTPPAPAGWGAENNIPQPQWSSDGQRFIGDPALDPRGDATGVLGGLNTKGMSGIGAELFKQGAPQQQRPPQALQAAPAHVPQGIPMPVLYQLLMQKGVS